MILKPLSDLNELITDYWPELLPGFMKVLEYSEEDQDISKIMRELMNSELICWVLPGTEGRLIDGFSTTKVGVTKTCPVKSYLLIHHSWLHPCVQPLTYTGQVQEFFYKYAQELGCDTIKVLSLRDIERWMGQWGFRGSYTEYIKEVKP